MDKQKKGIEMKRLIIFPIVAFLVGSLLIQQSWADTSSNSTASIEQRLDDLEQQIAILKRQLENSKEDAKAKSTETPVITANSKDGFSIKSPDGNYSLKLGGYTQVVAREFADNKKGELGYASSIIPRRVRLIISGTVAHDFDYYVQPEFGFPNTYSVSSGSVATSPSAYAVALQDAWIDWKYLPWATIKAGKFKTPFDLENLQDTRYTAFTELGLTSNLSPQRDVGVQLSGSLFDDIVNYQAGIFGGAADRENAYGGYSTGGDNNSKSGTGRIFLKPFKDINIESLKGFGISYAASYGKEKGTDLPTYVSPGQAPVFFYNTTPAVSVAGPQIRTEPQAYYYYKSLGILAEKVNSSEQLQYTTSGVVHRIKPTNRAWEITGNYVLTGEDASYTGVVPRHDFSLSGGHWGAFELVSRYGEFKADHTIFDSGFADITKSITRENTWGTGINWYLNRNVKLAADFEQTKFNRGAINGRSTDDRKTENLFTGLAQLSF